MLKIYILIKKIKSFCCHVFLKILDVVAFSIQVKQNKVFSVPAVDSSQLVSLLLDMASPDLKDPLLLPSSED